MIPPYSNDSSILKKKISSRFYQYSNFFNYIILDFEVWIVNLCIFPPQLSQKSPERQDRKARTWYFKAPRISCPEIACFHPNLFIGIWDASKSVQINSTRQADTICFSTTELDPTHASFIHLDCKGSLGTVGRWLNHLAMEESAHRIPLKDSGCLHHSSHHPTVFCKCLLAHLLAQAARRSVQQAWSAAK